MCSSVVVYGISWIFIATTLKKKWSGTRRWSGKQAGFDTGFFTKWGGREILA